jgi:hypothetical protein
MPSLDPTEISGSILKWNAVPLYVPFSVFRKVKTSRKVEFIEPKHKHELALLEIYICLDEEAAW